MARSEPADKFRLADTADERLLIEAAQQDRARFADVYERYFDLVYAYAGRRLRDRTKTEDVTSEVFQKALANLPRYKWTGAPFGAWLLRIAANVIADRAKREAREGRIGDDMLGNISDPKPGRQQTDLERCERQARLFRLVDELAADQRRVVVMRFAEEKSIKEIASAMQRSEGSIKQLQFRALENLRKLFSPKDTEKAQMKVQ